MILFKGYRYDGKSSARRNVTLVFRADGLAVSDDEALSVFYPHSEIKIAPKLAGKFRHLHFQDGSRCDVLVQPGLEEALQHIPGQTVDRFVFHLENRFTYLLVALLFSIAVIYGLIQYGVPVLSRVIAEQIPVELESRMGEETLQVFERMTAPSKLTEERQEDLRKKFNAVLASSGIPVRQIIFRDAKGIGANAFALPAGIILFTDQMVQLAQQDEELVAVFAHEAGHVKYRHGMRHLLQNSLSGLLVILLTGDIGAASSLAAALPTILLQSKFSRDVEAEADDFAILLLNQQGISPSHLGVILQRIEKEAGAGDLPGFLSTHPLTEERVRKFNGQASRPAP